MTIPLIDLVAQYQGIKPEIDAAIHQVVSRGQFILGPEVEAFEQELAAYCGAAHAVGVASGTDALELTLRACGIGPGDEVITAAFSFIASAEAIIAAGARPVFVDIDPGSYTLDVAKLDAAISPKTKAILPVHLYGHPCDLDALMRLAAPRKLLLIEDCAQAIGAEVRGRRVGSFGTAGCFSFFPSKNLGAYGDGGMVVTNDGALAEQVRCLRVHGSRRRYHHEVIGRNSRLDELQAAILRVKLRHLDEWNAARRRHAQAYRRAIDGAGLTELALPQEAAGAAHVYHLYTIRLEAREAVQQALTQAGIGCQVAYPSTLPAQPALAPWVDARQRFPVAEACARTVLSLPMYAELTAALLERVVEVLAKSAAVRAK
ncbi:MAG: DegT/DnrJ/EryC1/StrS family aminotransferase [Candidatus Omnitrophica bacterium]|nr:DegT/DnrJ/EryC1/StrS family aminotransferase [Candidatus Omnitrophota bacterium]